MQWKRIELRQIEGEPIRFSPIDWISFMSPMSYRITIDIRNYFNESKQLIDKQSELLSQES